MLPLTGRIGANGSGLDQTQTQNPFGFPLQEATAAAAALAAAAACAPAARPPRRCGRPAGASAAPAPAAPPARRREQRGWERRPPPHHLRRRPGRPSSPPAWPGQPPAPLRRPRRRPSSKSERGREEVGGREGDGGPPFPSSRPCAGRPMAPPAPAAGAWPTVRPPVRESGEESGRYGRGEREEWGF